MRKIKNLILAGLLAISSTAISNSITMDVVKQDGMGSSGTWLCPSLRDCYIKILKAEARGAAQYCSTITIKRDGQVVWFRDYNAPYWVNSLKNRGHDRGW